MNDRAEPGGWTPGGDKGQGRALGDPDDVAAVRRANADLYEAIERGDLDLMERVWAQPDEAADIICVHPGWMPLRGRADVLRSWALIMANTTYIQFVLTEDNIGVRGDVAVLSCEENILTGAEDSNAFVATGRIAATNAFVRTESGWRLWLHHSSPIISDDEDEDVEEP
ncbi:nuclear transport factor 2 family protein [Allonocardiopsis opalescens]|uniref:Ketosteroid isomerase-like protein n=1 Tax=Allonocardiopsis opalescens TaxID=1144618 RepID=A0A2T0Q221_9ACTN|nr:nuclear transport factor 2 family protein [Allonocardiopsis opalescens]PRX97844.1 ketosteroid isomerase-like protein [Allonocardiopsis opalescens]